MKYALCVKLCQHDFTIVIVHKLLIHDHCSESGLHSLPSRSSRCPRLRLRILLPLRFVRLREESGASALSGASSGQPPTPSTTPGPGNVPPPLVNPNLGIIPELLQESIDNLKGTDEGLESTSSSPATPIQTPHSPSLSHSFSSSRENHSVHPEQLAAGIHRLKVEEGMSSGMFVFFLLQPSSFKCSIIAFTTFGHT